MTASPTSVLETFKVSQWESFYGQVPAGPFCPPQKPRRMESFTGDSYSSSSRPEEQNQEELANSADQVPALSRTPLRSSRSSSKMHLPTIPMNAGDEESSTTSHSAEDEEDRGEGALIENDEDDSISLQSLHRVGRHQRFSISSSKPPKQYNRWDSDPNIVSGSEWQHSITSSSCQQGRVLLRGNSDSISSLEWPPSPCPQDKMSLSAESATAEGYTSADDDELCWCGEKNHSSCGELLLLRVDHQEARWSGSGSMLHQSSDALPFCRRKESIRRTASQSEALSCLPKNTHTE